MSKTETGGAFPAWRTDAMPDWSGKMKKRDIVTYSTRSSNVRAMVETLHRDGSVTVKALFYVGANGKDEPGYLGFKYRLSASDLRAAPGKGGDSDVG